LLPALGPFLLWGDDYGSRHIAVIGAARRSPAQQAQGAKPGLSIMAQGHTVSLPMISANPIALAPPF
jgi:hypothetical protein